jgi:hypothetical protein
VARPLIGVACADQRDGFRLGHPIFLGQSFGDMKANVPLASRSMQTVLVKEFWLFASE